MVHCGACSMYHNGPYSYAATGKPPLDWLLGLELDVLWVSSVTMCQEPTCVGGGFPTSPIQHGRSLVSDLCSLPITDVASYPKCEALFLCLMEMQHINWAGQDFLAEEPAC